MKSYSEEEIIKGCKRNSRKFQELLYFKYFDKMYGMCLRHTSDKEIAMTVLNDGFLKIFKNIEKYRYDGSFEGWVRKVIYNTLRDYYRKKSNNQRFLEIFENQGNDKNLNNLEYDDILRMIDTLPQKSKKVFVMYAIEGYKHHEISKILNIPVGTSKWHLSQAKEKLKRIIQKDELNKNIENYK